MPKEITLSNSRFVVDHDQSQIQQELQAKKMPLLDTELKEFESQEGITSVVECISPEIAKRYLYTQKKNRHPTETRIRDYSDRMLRGEWHVSQPIQFTSDGDLFDGQHRLMAVIRANISVDFLVVRGLPPETRYYVDIGQSRRAAQIATLMGKGTSLSTKLATCKAMFIGSELEPKNKGAKEAAMNLGVSVSKSFSPHKIIELYEKHQTAIDFADACRHVSPVRAVIARAYYHSNHHRLGEFIEVLNNGYTITPFDESAIALRNAITEMKMGKTLGGSTGRVVIYKKTISALANFLAKKNVRYVKEKDIELFPVADFD